MAEPSTRGPGDRDVAQTWDQSTCDVSHVEGRAYVCPRGALDLATVDILDQRIRKAADRVPRVVIDLGGLSFIDSTGLRLLLRWRAAAESDGIALSLRPGPPGVQRLFTITGVEDLLPFETSTGARPPRRGDETT